MPGWLTTYDRFELGTPYIYGLAVEEHTREIDPSRDIDKSYVRLYSDLTVSYRLRAVGGPAVSKHLHNEAPRRFSKVFEIFRPDTFFHSYVACRDAIHQMLMQTPVVGEFDLAADNWEPFLPHYIATNMLAKYRRDADEHGGVVPPRFNVVDMPVNIDVDTIYNEPKALLLAVTQCQFMSTTRTTMAPVAEAECCICMEDLPAKDSTDTMRLPSCSHCFHRTCIQRWFYKVSTCPVCRQDMAKCLVAVTNTPKGKFPGLPPPPP